MFTVAFTRLRDAGTGIALRQLRHLGPVDLVQWRLVTSRQPVDGRPNIVEGNIQCTSLIASRWLLPVVLDKKAPIQDKPLLIDTSHFVICRRRAG